MYMYVLNVCMCVLLTFVSLKFIRYYGNSFTVSFNALTLVAWPFHICLFWVQDRVNISVFRPLAQCLLKLMALLKLLKQALNNTPIILMFALVMNQD